MRNHPLPVSSSRAQPRDLSGRPISGRHDAAGKRNTKTSIFIFTLTWITAGQGRFLDFARNDVTRKPPAANVPPFRLYSATIREERSPQFFGHSSPLRTRLRGTHRRKRMDGSDLKTSEKPSAPRFVIPSAVEGSFWQTHKRPT